MWCLGTWSGKRDLNPRPLPWQGNALPTELFPQKITLKIVSVLLGKSNSFYLSNHEFKGLDQKLKNIPKTNG